MLDLECKRTKSVITIPDVGPDVKVIIIGQDVWIRDVQVMFTDGADQGVSRREYWWNLDTQFQVARFT